METETIDRLYLELSQITKAMTQREMRLMIALRIAVEELEKIVCVKGEDAGIFFVSTDSPTHFDAEKNCQVYDHEYFSPMGGALVELHRKLSEAIAKETR